MPRKFGMLARADARRRQNRKKRAKETEGYPYLLNFNALTDKERRRKNAFEFSHSKCKDPDVAAGGHYTYLISPSSIGTYVAIRCICGSKRIISDFDSW